MVDRVLDEGDMMSEKVLPQHVSPEASADFLGQDAPVEAKGMKSKASREAAAEVINIGGVLIEKEKLVNLIDWFIEELREMLEHEEQIITAIKSSDTENDFARGFVEGFEAGKESVLRKLGKILEWMER